MNTRFGYSGMVKPYNEDKRISQDAGNGQEDANRCRKRLSWGIGWYVYIKAHHVGPRYVSPSH
jgi:hypothetical protein